MIIIIHPGSLNLRIGRASDVNPHRILNAIARRRKPHGKIYRDTVLPGTVIKVRMSTQTLFSWSCIGVSNLIEIISYLFVTE